jgi:hypothetical protein
MDNINHRALLQKRQSSIAARKEDNSHNKQIAKSTDHHQKRREGLRSAIILVELAQGNLTTPIKRLLACLYAGLLLQSLPGYAVQTQRVFRCSNGLTFTLSSERDINEAFTENGVYITLVLNGKNFSMISAQGGDNTRFYGTDSDYSVIAWRSVTLLKGNKYLGERCT